MTQRYVVHYFDVDETEHSVNRDTEEAISEYIYGLRKHGIAFTVWMIVDTPQGFLMKLLGGL